MSGSESNPVNELAGRRADRLAEKTTVSGKMSETCRFVGFGLLAIFYTIKSGDSSFASSLWKQHSCVLLAMALFGFLAVLLDYLQYLFGYYAVQKALVKDNYLYDEKSAAYLLRNLCFKLKQVAVIVGSALLIMVLLRT